MPSPNINIGDLIATGIESRRGELADNMSINMPLLMRMKKRGNIVPITGGTKILEELEYAENSNAGFYGPYDTMPLAPQELFSAAEYDIRMLFVPVVTSGFDTLVNSGKEQIINLVKKRVDNALSTGANLLARGVHSDGTGFNGRQILGMQTFLSSNPALGTVGGINRASWTFWRNRTFSGTTDGGAAVSATNIRGYMRRLGLQLVRNGEFPDLIVLDLNYYNLFAESLVANQRLEGNDEGGSGFMALKFYDHGYRSDVVFAGADVGMPANTGYFLNTKYLRMRPHKDRNMQLLGGTRRPVNQDAEVQIMGWAGNVTCSNLRMQGILVA
jgi:hypothetical protein